LAHLNQLHFEISSFSPAWLPLNRIGIIAGHNAAFLLHDAAWSAWTARQLAILSDRVVLHFQDSDRSYTT
jgi:hypothetical protein